MNKKREFKLNTPEGREEILYYLIKSIVVFDEKKAVIKELEEVYHYLNAEGLYSNGIVNFVSRFNKPLKPFLFEDNEKEWEKHDSIVRMVFENPLLIGNIINEAALEFFYFYNDDGDRWSREQENMRIIVKHCQIRREDQRYVTAYNKIRLKVINKSIDLESDKWEWTENILNEEEFLRFKITFKFDPVLEKMVENLFEKIEGPKKIVLCNYCHMPLRDNNKCINNEICFYNETISKEPNKVINIGSNEHYYRVKDGVHYFNLLPGIEEVHLYRWLKQKYEKYGVQVILYPSVEIEGDIQLRYKDKKYSIDLKDFKDEAFLWEKLNEQLQSVRDKQYIYIPKRRVEFANDYIGYIEEKLKNKLGETAPKVGTQDKLIKEINKWLKKLDGVN